jgi:hypothetical protein
MSVQIEDLALVAVVVVTKVVEAKGEEASVKAVAEAIEAAAREESGPKAKVVVEAPCRSGSGSRHQQHRHYRSYHEH